MAELALELLCQRAASRSTFGRKLYQHVSFDPRRDCCRLADSLRNAPLLAGGRRSLDRRVPPHDRADAPADAARRSRPGHCRRPGCSQTGETFTSEVSQTNSTTCCCPSPFQIAMIKVAAARMVCKVTDCAIQVYGGAGVSGDVPLAQM